MSDRVTPDRKKRKKEFMRARRTKAKGTVSPTAASAQKSRVATVSPISKAREALRAAIDRACIARGEAQWTNGYRAARCANKPTEAEQDRLYTKEMQQFTFCGLAEARVESAIRAYTRAIRRLA